MLADLVHDIYVDGADDDLGAAMVDSLVTGQQQAVGTQVDIRDTVLQAALGASRDTFRPRDEQCAV